MPRVLAPNSAASGEVSSSEFVLNRKSKRVDTLLNVALALTVCAGIAIYKFPIFTRELYASQPTYNFGTVKAGMPVRHTFTLRNLHPWAVTITRLHSDCGCTKSVAGRNVPFELKPFEQIAISTTVNTNSKQGYVSQNVAVITADNSIGTPLLIEGKVH